MAARSPSVHGGAVPSVFSGAKEPGMSKSQKRSNKEVRKPKAVKSAAAAPANSPFGASSFLLPKKRK
jgi:hypothetical protein